MSKRAGFCCSAKWITKENENYTSVSDIFNAVQMLVDVTQVESFKNEIW